MTTFYDLQEKANELAKSILFGDNEDDVVKEVNAEELGLDERASWSKMYAGPDFVAARLDADGKLQYYGGFEYIDKEHRVVVGNYVFYSAESERVQDCLDRLNGTESVDSDE